MPSTRNPKPVEEMTRTEMVYELARHAHPQMYHKMTRWPTPMMASILCYYRVSERDGESMELSESRETEHGISIKAKQS